ncbi:hypothetical protein [Mycobacterium camsae]|uniref:hypothetical protein n=1 Tax=Mycobacterium gordonae TaxID=1778 RepID=UPI00197E1FDD|nr:hypothetical protein [Mycobacterium gordonae]
MQFGVKCAITVTAIGVAATGVTLLSPPHPLRPTVSPVAFQAPLPLAPLSAVPSQVQLLDLLNGFASPTDFSGKGDLVQGGLTGWQIYQADLAMNKAQFWGLVPFTFGVTDIAPAGPNTATAEVSTWGPRSGATTRSLTFVNDGGWKISNASAGELLYGLEVLTNNYL